MRGVREAGVWGGSVRRACETGVRREGSFVQTGGTFLEQRVAQEAREAQSAVFCRGVTVSFTGAHNELQNIDLTISPGERVALVGPSGCGKSTLLRVIAGLLEPDAGIVKVFGCDGSPAERGIGFVFQEATLFPWLNALENVALPLELKKHLSAADCREHAAGALKDVGLLQCAGKYPRELSGGMKQRLALARALVTDSRVLLLDEPFAAIDALRRERFNYELWRLARKKNLTMLVVTHSINEAVSMSQRVVVMAEDPGRIVGEVTVDLPEQRDLTTWSSQNFFEACTQVRQILEETGALMHADADMDADTDADTSAGANTDTDADTDADAWN